MNSVPLKKIDYFNSIYKNTLGGKLGIVLKGKKTNIETINSFQFIDSGQNHHKNVQNLWIKYNVEKKTKPKKQKKQPLSIRHYRFNALVFTFSTHSVPPFKKHFFFPFSFRSWIICVFNNPIKILSNIQQLYTPS